MFGKIFDAIAAGVNWVQIRGKDLPTRELLALVQRSIDASEAREPGESNPDSQPHHAKVIVNDRLDVAIAAAAAGVHLGSASAPLREVVSWCRSGNAPREFLIGASCHTLAEACGAEKAGAGYVIFGPVFDTPSKREFGPPAGIAQLAAVCATLRIPVLAIGGVDTRNAGECRRAGAAGIAGIRIFQDARDAAELRGTVELLRNDFTGSATR